MRQFRRLVAFLTVLGALLLPTVACAGIYDEMEKAINENDSATVSDLLKRGMDVDSVDPAGNTLLIIASRNGNEQMVEMLLRHHASPLKINKYGDSALMLAALKGHLDIVTALVAAGAEMNPDDGWTALIYAAFEGHSEVVRFLLDKGADIDAQAPNGATALMFAARNGHRETVALLLQDDADYGIVNQDGNTALNLAIAAGQDEVADMLRKAGARK